MFFDIRYADSGWKANLAAIYDLIKYRLARPVVSWLVFYTYFIFRFKTNEKTWKGGSLKAGISVYIPCKNEAAHLLLSLESLIGIAEQFILIDNGSDDGTLELMKAFQAEHSDKANIIILSRPDSLLVEMVQEALTYVEHRWVLKWDGDMLAVTENLISLKKSLQKIARPTAFSLPRLALAGDYEHVSSIFPFIDIGEPFLRTFYNRFHFKEEFGRLEHARIPIYYRLKAIRKKIFSFHFSELRPPLRQMYRHCYLDWRETMNTESNAVKEKYQHFETFRSAWMMHNFGTAEESSCKYRASRLIANSVKRYDPKKYYPYPLPLEKIIRGGTQQFSIIYQNGKPWLMNDLMDNHFQKYQPTGEDIEWQPDHGRFLNDSKRMAFVKSVQ